MSLRYLPSISSGSEAAARVPVEKMAIEERQGFGWTGSALIDLAPEDHISIGGAFSRALSANFLPGWPIFVQLAAAVDTTRDSTPDEVVPVRVWPSMITKVEGISGVDPDNPYDGKVEVFFADPWSYLGDIPIWGVFANVSPGELVGGAMSLATGGDGVPTLTPFLGVNHHVIAISQNIHRSARAIPYAIATGEPLREWLFLILARFGIRLEITGDLQGSLGISLKDLRPMGTPIPLTIEDQGAIDTRRASVVAVQCDAVPEQRAVTLDNQASGDIKRIGYAGSIGAVFNTALTTPAQVEMRSSFLTQFANLNRVRMLLTSGQPALRPGRLLQLNSAITDVGNNWQVNNITHNFTSRSYSNAFSAYIGDIPWRPPVMSTENRAIIVSALIDDSGSESGEAVPRNKLGRVPVSLSFTQNEVLSQGATAPSGGAAAPSQPENWPPRLHLPIVEQMAGAVHGFVPMHRQGDMCRVVVRSPLFAEILGFSYRDNLRVGEEIIDSSAGIVVGYGEEKTDWSGLIFRPNDYFDDEIKATDGDAWFVSIAATGDSDSSDLPDGDDTEAPTEADDMAATLDATEMPEESPE